MAPHQGPGTPWQKYIDEESRSTAVIRDRGIPVWSLIGQYRTYRGDSKRVLAAYDGHLTAGELDAALAYYWAKPYRIDEKLRDNSGDDDGPYVRVSHSDAPLQQDGEQTWRKYIDEESRNVATIRNKGYSVWSLVRYFRVYGGNKERALAGYQGDLTSEELDAALAYYWAKPHAIDRKLKEIST